jgi:Fic family protein
MQVVSGPIGKEKVHFIAPPAVRLDTEVTAFLDWFDDHGHVDPALGAGLAHLWFVTIHPFDDGNGRIARAVTDMALARSERTPQRFYSMSSQIRQERDAYYEILERTQRGTLDVTDWLEWFLTCFSRAILRAQETLRGVLYKARFWERHGAQSLNQRQVKVLNRLLEGFEGKLTTSKWAAICGCSQDSAYRDILDLVGRGILSKDSSRGRSASYSLTEV